MRDIIVIFVIIILVFGGTFILHSYIETSGDELVTILDEMSGDIDSSQSNEKQVNIDKINKKWDEVQKVWISIEYHNLINDMEDLVIECCNYYLETEKNDFNISYAKLKRMIEDLKYREEISMVNIF